MGEKLQATGIGIIAWLCFFEAILAPWCAGLPATLNLFGVYELPIIVPFVLLWEWGITTIVILVLMFLFIGLPVIMGVLFIYYTCLHLFTPKLKVVTVKEEEVERMKQVIDEVKTRNTNVKT